MMAYVLLRTGHCLIYFYIATAMFNRHSCELPGERFHSQFHLEIKLCKVIPRNKIILDSRNKS